MRVMQNILRVGLGTSATNLRPYLDNTAKVAVDRNSTIG